MVDATLPSSLDGEEKKPSEMTGIISQTLCADTDIAVLHASSVLPVERGDSTTFDCYLDVKIPDNVCQVLTAVDPDQPLLLFFFHLPHLLATRHHPYAGIDHCERLF